MSDPLSPDLLSAELLPALASVTVRACRLYLDTSGVVVSVPMLRGVWGAALRELEPPLYQHIFEGGGDCPLYLLRPAPLSRPGPAVDFLLFGPADAQIEQWVWAAWSLALQRGLGPDRRSARLLDVRPLAWDQTILQPAMRQPGFTLAHLPWPFDPSRPCILLFPSPLRLIRDRRLITTPTLPDIVLAALRRLQALAPQQAALPWDHRHDWLDLARRIPATPWQGEQCDLVRYSGRQRAELDMHGVVGQLTLPAGPGPLADLLLAASWFHVGKSTVMGLGQLCIDRPTPPR